jgi:hypothetical protein
MASLSNTKIKDTYQSIVKFNDNGNITTSAKQLTDGFGNNSPLYVSTTQIGIGVTPTVGYDLHINSNSKIGGNLIVGGNLTVSGTLTYLDVEDLAIEDPLIKLARNNTANSLDIGFYGQYVESTVIKFKGLFNDASDGKWKLFIGTSNEPTTVVNTGGTGYTVGTLVSSLEGNVIGNVTGDISGNSGTVTNGVYIIGNQTIAGIKTFSSSIVSNLTGNVTGNADTSTKILSITNSNIVQLTTTQTLTNKTLTSPTITGTGAIAGTFTGNLTGNVSGNLSGNVTGNAYLNTVAYQGGEGTELDNTTFNTTGIGTTFRWIESNSDTTGTTWKKVCDVVLSTGFQNGLQLEVKILQPNTKWGDTAGLYTLYYSVAFRGEASDVGPDYNDALVYGPDANLLRVYKLSTDNYELQARSNDNYRDLVVECNITSKKNSKLTPTTTYTNGTITGGTAYTASPNNTNITKFAGDVEFEGAVFDDATVDDLRVNGFLYIGAGADSTYGGYLVNTGATAEGIMVVVDDVDGFTINSVTGNAGEQDTFFKVDDAVKLYDANGIVLETVLGGVDVTGTLDVTGDVFSDGLYINSTTAVSGTQVAIVGTGSENLQRWGSANSGQASYRFRIDQYYKFIANSGSGDNLTIFSDTGNIETSGSLTTQGVDGGLVLRNWQAGTTTFAMLGTANMINSEYSVLTNGTDTYIGSGTSGNTYIRGANNDSTQQLVISSSNAAFAGSVEAGKTLRITGFSDPTSGVGIELMYNSGHGYLISYDRGNSLYKPLKYVSSNHIFEGSGYPFAKFNQTFSYMSNTDSGNFEYANLGGRLLTSNGTNWDADGRDPILTLSSSGNSNSTEIANSIGLNLYHNSNNNDTFSPAITFSSLSASNNYASTYGMIIGKKTGQGVDSNWNAGELQFYTGKVGAYMSNVPDLRIDSSGNAYFAASITVAGSQYFNGEFIEGDGKEMFRYSDTWLRINEDNDFTSGIYCGTGVLRTDGTFKVGDGGGITVNPSGEILIKGTYNPYTTNDRGNITLNGTGTNIIAFTNNTVGKGYIYHNGTDLEMLNIAGNLKLSTANIERLHISNSGNVGVGTTGFAIDSKLHVQNGSAGSVTAYADTILTLESSASNSFLSFLSPSGANQGILFGDAVANWRGQLQYDHSTDKMIFYAAATNVATINSSGLGVGGTPTANYPLTLRSKSGDYTKILDWGTDVGGSWGTMQIQITSPYATELRSGAWNFAQGSVGIGKSPDAAYHLDVNGKVQIVAGMNLVATTSTLYATDGALSYYSASNGVYLNGAGASGWLRLQASGVENDQNSINIYGSAGNFMNFRTANSTRLLIDASGNATFYEDIIVKGGGDIDGGWNIGLWLANASYNFIGTNNMSGSEYCLLTDGTETYLGAGTGGTTHIRGAANSSVNQLVIAPNGASFYGNTGFQNTSPQFNVHSGTTVAIPNSRYLNFVGSGATEIGYANFKQALVFSANDSTATSNPKSIGIILHNESTQDNNFTPMLAFGAQSNSGNYSQVVAGIAGKRLGTAGDSNWSAGELWFWTGRSDTIGGSNQGLPAANPAMVMTSTRQIGIGTTTPSSGVRLEVQDEALFNSLSFKNNRLNSGYHNAANNIDIWINYEGYLNSTSYYRDFRVGNGRAGQIMHWDGDTSRVAIGESASSNSARFQVLHNGNNGEGGDSNYGILAKSSTAGQATIGAVNTGDGYANLNLGSNASGLKFWHISKRTSTDAHRIEMYYNAGSFVSLYKFETGGEFYAAGSITSAGDVIAFSDKRVKENIKTIDNALEKVLNLRGVSYNRTDIDDKSTKIGVIAQEVKKVLPEVVNIMKMMINMVLIMVKWLVCL